MANDPDRPERPMTDIFEALGISPDAVEISTGASQLAELGVRRGGTLLVHAAFKPMRREAGSLANVIGTLVRCLGDDGTLLIPALSFKDVTRTNPVFDVDRTPSCIGAIPEFFRRLPVTRRSIHPTHSVCGYGAGVDEILGNHEGDSTPVGENSPFRALPARNGQLLMLGCGLRPNTSMHGVEEVAEAPYLFGDPITYTVIDGPRRYTTRHRRHDFYRLEQRYDRMSHLLREPQIKRGGLFGAECWLIETEALWEMCAARIREEPYYFVEPVIET